MKHLLGIIALTSALSLSAIAGEEEKRDYFMLRAAPDLVLKYDIGADEVVATAHTKHGIISNTTMTHDKKQLFFVTAKQAHVEVLDVAKMEFVEDHNFERPDWLIRVESVREIPGGTHWYVNVDRIRRKPDRFVIEEGEWLHYDRAERKTLDNMKELPSAIRRSASISPDGKNWLVSRDGLTLINAKTLKKMGHVDLSTPRYTGMGSISLRGDDFFDHQRLPLIRHMYTMRDPVKRNRTLMGLIDINLETFEVVSLEEWGAANSMWRLYYTKDRKLGFGTKRGERRSQVDGQDPLTVVVTVDLTNGRTIREARIEHRNGLSLSAISPDGTKLYFSGRGHEFEIYDPEGKHLKTVELEGEIDGRPLLIQE